MAKKPFKKRLKKRLKRLPDYPAYLLAAGALKLLSLIPRPTAYRLSTRLAKLIYRLCPWWRNYILRNLLIAMPDITQAQAKDIAIKTFARIGWVAIEMSHLPELKGKDMEECRRVVEIEPVVLTTIGKLLSRGKGLLYLTGHLGVWELLPALHAVSVPGTTLSIIVRPLDNPYMDRLVNSYRTCLGYRVIPKKNSIREILAALKRNETIGILLDQNVCRAEGVFVDFFGKTACTNFGLAMLALRTETPVLPIGLFYDEAAGVHRVHIEPEVPLIRTGNKAEDIRLNTAAYTKALETMIRKYPDQWLWVHRRWKTRPEDGEAQVYSEPIRLRS